MCRPLPQQHQQHCLQIHIEQSKCGYAYVVCRQKLDDGQARPTPADQHLTAYADQAGSDSEDFKPSLQSDDAHYLRKRKLHMDSLLDCVADG